MICFQEPFTNKNKIEVELYQSNYATKLCSKNATGIDTSKFAKKDGFRKRCCKLKIRS